MKQTIIECLTYPRMVMLSHMDAERCPLQLQFDPEFRRCLCCERGLECQWLTDHNEFQALTEKPVQHLYEAMLFCIQYIESLSILDGHNVSRCACEYCHWSRDARFIFRQLGEELAAAEDCARSRVDVAVN